MRRSNTSRSGFTLVELLVVLTIIGILVGLLVPVIMSAQRRGRQAQAEAQLNTIAQALASFNTKFGRYPPSRLIFHESGYLGTPPNGDRYFAGHLNPSPPIGGRSDGPEAGSPEHRELVQRSIQEFRSIWPRVNLSPGIYPGSGPFLGPGGQAYDINGNREVDPLPILMDGHECLAFFLCGIGDWEPPVAGSGYELRGMGGWNTNPRNPFVAVPLDGPGATRTPMFYEVRSPDELSDDDQDGMPGLLDTIGRSSDARYIAYFAARNSVYDPRDVRLEDSVAEFFQSPAGLFQAFGPNPIATTPTNRPGQAPRWLRPQSYQLISPGLDRVYGPGGHVVIQGNSWEYPDGRGRFEEDNVMLK